MRARAAASARMAAVLASALLGAPAATAQMGGRGPSIGYVAVLALSTVTLALYLRRLVVLNPVEVAWRVRDIASYVQGKLRQLRAKP